MPPDFEFWRKRLAQEEAQRAAGERRLTDLATQLQRQEAEILSLVNEDKARINNLLELVNATPAWSGRGVLDTTSGNPETDRWSLVVSHEVTIPEKTEEHRVIDKTKRVKQRVWHPDGFKGIGGESYKGWYSNEWVEVPDKWHDESVVTPVQTVTEVDKLLSVSLRVSLKEIMVGVEGLPGYSGLGGTPNSSYDAWHTVWGYYRGWTSIKYSSSWDGIHSVPKKGVLICARGSEHDSYVVFRNDLYQFLGDVIVKPQLLGQPMPKVMPEMFRK